MIMARNGLETGGSVLALTSPTELWTGPKSEPSLTPMVNASTPVTSSTSGTHTSSSSNQDVINLQYMDLEEFLLENAVAVVQQHTTNNSNSSDSKVYIDNLQSPTPSSTTGMLPQQPQHHHHQQGSLGDPSSPTGFHQQLLPQQHQTVATHHQMSNKQYQVNLEQRLDQTDSLLLGLPTGEPEASVDLNSSIRTLNRVMSLPANTVSSQPCLTNLSSATSPIRHISGDAVALPTSPSPPSSLHGGTPSSPSSMGEFSPAHAHNDPIDMPNTQQSAAAKRRALKRSRKESVPDENKDDKYWRRRAKNNEAAKRSRDLRREKETHILQRVAYLERENQAIHQELKVMKMENDELRKRLSRYEAV